MYRNYESPSKLEEMLREVQKEYDHYSAIVKEKGTECDEADILMGLCEEIEELKERINFAWQDDEYDACNEWAGC